MSEQPASPRLPGDDLVAFFQASPLAGIELDLERDKSLPRDVDFPDDPEQPE
jgi:hypothetical protein